MIDILQYHRTVVEEYERYIKGFININDPKIRQVVEEFIGDKKLWPEPLIQFNPGYEPGIPFGNMTDADVHPQCGALFPFEPYKHQEESLRLGAQKKHFVVISGTGSGKSVSYLATIFNHLLKTNGLNPSPGVHALIVYPMNALINSQFKAIEDLKTNYEKTHGKDSFPFTFKKYTGQESDTEKKAIREQRPNILLTNYVMLELMLVRAKEASLRSSIFENLQFLVFDELHTYRGRQGSDVALLIRRLKEEAGQELVCIGTSATMSSSHDPAIQKDDVAKVASKVFGVQMEADQIVTETLRKVITNAAEGMEALRLALQQEVDSNGSEQYLQSHPLANWLEEEVALEMKNGSWYRRKPQTLPEVVHRLADDTGIEWHICKQRLSEMLNLIQQVNLRLFETSGKTSYLQFRLHQFFLQTGSVYATMELPATRFVTLDEEPYVEKDGERVRLFPVVFSRLSGEVFFRVRKSGAQNLMPWADLALRDPDEEPGEEGYFTFSPTDSPDFWQDDLNFYKEVLPSEWFDARKSDRIDPKKKSLLPQRIFVDKHGNISEEDLPDFAPGWFVKAPMPFDMTVNGAAFYDSRTRDNTKLARIGNEGRSTATTVLCISAALALHQLKAAGNLQKVMSFTDNRQDAALQAGHFNDFISTALIRSAINHALHIHGSLTHADIAQNVAAILDLKQEEYAETPSGLSFGRAANEKALQAYLFYRIVEDLRRGWRVILPNLEQCALLKIDYRDIDEMVQDHFWENVPEMAACPHEKRKNILFDLFEFMRSQFAVYSVNYEPNLKENNVNEIRQRLKAPWKFDAQERLYTPAWMRVDKTTARVNTESLHYMSAWGKYLKHEIGKPGLRGERINEITRQILEVLAAPEIGYLKVNTLLDKEQPLYQLPIEHIIWKPGDGNQAPLDRVRLRIRDEAFNRPNEFFKEFYQRDISGLKYRLAGEHTGQLGTERRIQNERAFRHEEDVKPEERLTALFCSPTMELGIDIAELNTVHMRNVPPSPANYVQRSGRAGRSGQGALVMTYCARQNPHDRHFFNNRIDMVAGVVTPPNLDLMNEELWKTHIHSVYLAACALEQFDDSIDKILDIWQPAFPLLDEISQQLQLSEAALEAVRRKADKMLQTAFGHGLPWWFRSHWLDDVLRNSPQEFDRAFDRWRQMYLQAQEDQRAAGEIINHPNISRNHPDYKDAKRRQDRAQEQMDALRNKNKGEQSQSEFLPYRYLASEGFLPGYNFPRLPRRVILESSATGGNFISRGRLQALTEFGPQNTIYYDGQKYQINYMKLPPGDEGLSLQEAKISKQSGYILTGKEATLDTDPFSGADLNKADNVEKLFQLLEFQDGRAKLTDRISCEEEERMRKGYDEDIYFRSDHFESRRRVTVYFKGDELLHLHYLPSAQLVKINRKWRVSKAQAEGFAINTRTGQWLAEREVEEYRNDPEKRDLFARVKLYTTATANALYIEPCSKLNLQPDGVLTLLYSLKRALEQHFQMEPRELAAELMGSPENPNIFIYESAEGSLGVLSQIVDNVEAFRDVAKIAYQICHFEDGEDKHPKGKLCEASYEDLLDYYNQRFHGRINRFQIKQALELLTDCRFDNTPGLLTYGEQFQKIYSQTDPKSRMERALLDYLHSEGLRLPDRAQVNMSPLGCYASADFVYERERVAIFIDGAVHDLPQVAEADLTKRECLERLGWAVVEWNYRKPVSDFVKQYPTIFTKARS
jgi:superfamily II DNA/RNA helicase/very-short-patch-repair endonuclease